VQPQVRWLVPLVLRLGQLSVALPVPTRKESPTRCQNQSQEPRRRQCRGGNPLLVPCKRRPSQWQERRLAKNARSRSQSEKRSSPGQRIGVSFSRTIWPGVEPNARTEIRCRQGESVTALMSERRSCLAEAYWIGVSPRGAKVSELGRKPVHRETMTARSCRPFLILRRVLLPPRFDRNLVPLRNPPLRSLSGEAQRVPFLVGNTNPEPQSRNPLSGV